MTKAKEYVSNSSFMTSQVKIPNLFGGDYEDPLEALKVENIASRAKTDSISETQPTSKIDKNKTDLTGLTELTNLTELTELTIPLVNQPISPVRDFTKTPNSIARNIMASGLFKGKSKQIYDYLWTASRGKINPTRTVRKTHAEIQKGSGIGSLNTVKNGLNYLEQIGLIFKTSAVGEASGNTYETFTPEEANLTNANRPVSPVGSVSSVRQKMVQPVQPETNRTNLTQTTDSYTSYSIAKTSFKDNDLKSDDDAREAFSMMIQKFDAAVRKFTDKGVSKREAEKWGRLADLLILELEVAASRASGISSVPAFLTEILRRQFFASRSASAKSPKTEIDTVGKSDSGNYEIKLLDKKGREEALDQLREFADEKLLQDFKKWYVEDDWKWLIKNLKSV